jgi:hypothetical protein
MLGTGGAGLDAFLEVVVADFRFWLADVEAFGFEALGGMMGVVGPLAAGTLRLGDAIRLRGVAL